jgi:transposase
MAKRTPIFVRELSGEERTAIAAGLRSREAFVLRRCQILLASANGKRASQIGAELGCDTDTVLNAINAFNKVGLEALKAGSSRPKVIERAFDDRQAEQLRALLHQSPRELKYETSRWTLALAAEACLAQGITPKRVSLEAVRMALLRLGVRWKRAKQWITSPDPAYVRKKNDATG